MMDSPSVGGQWVQWDWMGLWRGGRLRWSGRWMRRRRRSGCELFIVTLISWCRGGEEIYCCCRMMGEAVQISNLIDTEEMIDRPSRQQHHCRYLHTNEMIMIISR
eukprot:scaffold39655_cov168-Skeletonema_marinoi.AAC.1